MSKWATSRWILCGLLLLALNVQADLNEQYQLLDAIQSNPQTQSESARLGEEKASLCGYCHGTDGNSKREFIPNLAGQNAKYLINQFEQFATGKRKNYVMSQLADKLSLEERVNLAIHFSHQKAKPFVAKKPNSKLSNASPAQGQAGFQAKCQMCHGVKAEGWDQLPRLASQPAAYLVKTLEKFKTDHRDRNQSPMTAIAKGLSNQEIKDIAVYLSSLE
ncbi:c-type cytochrome [Litoribrevibacter albus]|uniref:Cytochrome c n=1 Tax=Litoribrevibacter albus TaxID=1473156 RepID=A0AA37SDL0_9GAMM|nr:c-type cytochrome [Litoribrevibacter albus]GLQ32478.1 cytochrome c [Litoribrevibacter albus]